MRIPASSLVVLLLASPWAASGAPAIDLYPAIGRPTLVTLSGRVLRSSPEEPSHHPSVENVRRLATKGLEKVGVEVAFGGQLRRVTSGDDGQFEVSFPAPSDRPFPLGSQPVRAQAEGTSAESRVEVVSDTAPFIVVSDFDDTLAASNIQKVWAMLHTALFEDAETQAVIPGMADLFRCLRAASDPPPGFAIVTGTPLAFGRRLESFLSRHGFPFAAVHLRRWGPKTLTTSFKDPVLRRLLSEFPQPFVLVGDSGEHDPEVYAAIRREFPGRVSAIFIRDVGRSADAARFQEMVLFRTAGDAAREAAARGLLSRPCLEASFPQPAR